MLDVIAVDERTDLESLKVAMMDARLTGAAFVVDNVQRLDQPCVDLLASFTVKGSSEPRHFGSTSTLKIYDMDIKAFFFDTSGER